MFTGAPETTQDPLRGNMQYISFHSFPHISNTSILPVYIKTIVVLLDITFILDWDIGDTKKIRIKKELSRTKLISVAKVSVNRGLFIAHESQSVKTQNSAERGGLGVGGDPSSN